MNYRTLSDMATVIREKLYKIPRVNVVVGIPRSGLIAASMIATLTNQELRTMSEMGSAHYDSILLVDDSIAGGDTMLRHWNAIKNWHPRATIITLAIYVKASSPRPDIHLEEVAGPRVFEWQWHRSKHLISALCDIDGVISTETQPEKREAGELLYRPDRRVLALATGRREYERAVTESWLYRHGVRYGKLFMTIVPDGSGGKKARETKLEACQEMKPKWIVESNIHQAEWLRARTGLPILCTDANRMLT